MIFTGHSHGNEARLIERTWSKMRESEIQTKNYVMQRNTELP